MSVLQLPRAGESQFFLALNAPWRMRAIVARMIEAERVARRIAQPGFVPEPRLHRRLMLEHNTGGLQPGDLCIDVVALEIDVRSVVARDLFAADVERECRSAVRKFEARIILVLDDEVETELAIESD